MTMTLEEYLALSVEDHERRIRAAFAPEVISEDDVVEGHSCAAE